MNRTQIEPLRRFPAESPFLRFGATKNPLNKPKVPVESSSRKGYGATTSAIDKMKPSAYKSARLANLRLNKTKEKGGLRQWFDEKWRNLTPKLLGDNDFYNCGTQSKEQREEGLPSVCRPTIRVNSKTTTPLAQQITRKQLKKAVDIKKQGNRINWSQLD